MSSPGSLAAIAVRVAHAGDDAGIRKLLREVPLPGAIRVAMPREPDFFASTAVEGREVGVVLAENRSSGRVIGLCLRAVKECYVNGRPTALGYLGGLRLSSTRESLAVLRRGATQFRAWHDAGEARLYLECVTDGNARADGFLRAARLGFPVPEDFGRLRTRLVKPAMHARLSADASVEVRQGRPGDLAEVAAFLRGGARRQFFPVYREEDFGPAGLLRGLKAEDLFLARRNGELVGTLGLWDQTAFKQNVVTGYGRGLAALRPLYNVYARLRSRPTLPPPGAEVRHANLALICVRDEDKAVFSSLLRSALRAAETRYPGGYVAMLMHEKDPFASIAAALPGHAYASRLYVCRYPDGTADFAALDGRVPYVELGSL